MAAAEQPLTCEDFLASCHELQVAAAGGSHAAAAAAAAPQLHHVFQLGQDVPVVHQFLRAVLVGHVAPGRAAGVVLRYKDSCHQGSVSSTVAGCDT